MHSTYSNHTHSIDREKMCEVVKNLIRLKQRVGWSRLLSTSSTPLKTCEKKLSLFVRGFCQRYQRSIAQVTMDFCHIVQASTTWNQRVSKLHIRQINDWACVWWKPKFGNIEKVKIQLLLVHKKTHFDTMFV